MGSSREKSDVTLEKAEQIGQFLESVTAAVNTILEMNMQISASAQEQSVAIHEINGSIKNTQTTSSETSHGSDQPAQASQEVATLSSDLQALVGKFKVS
jgi:methyl-accepting chemotaxis protein